MAKGISVDNLARTIVETLEDYTEEVEQALEKEKVKVAKDGAKKLKDTSPRRRPRYHKGWSVVKVGTAQVIRNRTDYQLTHLLENGHAKRGGGRVAPVVHIAPVEAEVIKNFEDAVRRAIQK